MRTGVVTSVILHAALLIIALVGLGSAKPLEPEVVESIAVDLVPITDITNIRAGSLDSKIVETDTPAVAESDKPAELAQKTGNTTEDQVTPEETNKSTPAPVVNTAPEPTPADQPKQDPTPTPDPTPPPPDPAPAPEPAPTPEETQPDQQVATDTPTDAPAAPVAPMPASRPAQLQKSPTKADTPTKVAAVAPKPVDTPKPTEKPKPTNSTPATKTPTKQTSTPAKPNAKPADQVADLINSEDSRGATTGQGGTPTLGKTTGKAATLTQSQLDGLVAQIKSCMSVPAGAAEAGITAQLHFNIDAGGNVVGMPDIVSADPSTLGRALASAAQRAVMRCGPYSMAVGQEVQATFDPRELT